MHLAGTSEGHGLHAAEVMSPWRKIQRSRHRRPRPRSSEQIRGVLTVTPPMSSMNFMKLPRSTTIMWLIFRPVRLSTAWIVAFGPPHDQAALIFA